ncbi:substrate-binding domain-containing protein [Proteiniborus sp. MB09-C3]|uniref:substrate-binding domain-containing protein n=1 Tax=Proteiniborus sp. MB09-C3 TaxID=3050072 RepID=UPI0025556450|nr:substrate-binding domain-containing protein [Proteiniborus sp. MB09-C3]WIV12577.1 extracellular solute-binding protein [Proteiniborus sp. MB09-C3]
MKKVLLISLSILLIFTLLVGCSANKKIGGSIILSTTTSTQDSGLLDYLLPEFTKDTGVEVRVVSVGTGQALQNGKDGNADVLLVHAKASEEEFVNEGHGIERHDVMYNDFILVGPKYDPLKSSWQVEPGNDIEKALSYISEHEVIFVSRGDDSGTHKKELEIWKETGIEPQGDWYLSAGSGMADVLKIASEKQGYTLTDRATYLSLRDTLDLDIIIEKDENLFNQYGIIPVNPEKSDKINAEGAKAFMDWMLSKKGQELIGKYGVEKYGMPLFVPNAK